MGQNYNQCGDFCGQDGPIADLHFGFAGFHPVIVDLQLGFASLQCHDVSTTCINVKSYNTRLYRIFAFKRALASPAKH